MTPIYLDWAATAPSDKDILIGAAQLAAEYYGNPSSVHAAGQQARKKLEEARSCCARILEVQPQQLYFTSGGTESDHYPLLSLLQRPSPGSIVIDTAEHPAVINQVEQLKNLGWKVVSVNPDHDGIVRPQSVAAVLQPDTCLVMVQAVNNETGAIQPVTEIGALLTEYGKNKRKPKFHIDAVQALGKTTFSLTAAAADSAAFSAHKIAGPRGCGLLYLKERMEPFLRGGGQENGIRPGTENVAGAVAFSECMKKYLTALPKEFEHAQDCMEQLIAGLRIIPGAELIPATRTDRDPRYSPFVLQVSFRNIPGEVLVRGLSAQGIYISTGSACSSKKKTRPVLQAMGISAGQAQTAVRFSIGYTTTSDDISKALTAVRSFIAAFLGENK